MPRTEISTAQAARILRISTDDVRTLIEHGEICARRELGVGAKWIVSYHSVLDYKTKMEAAAKKKK